MPNLCRKKQKRIKICTFRSAVQSGGTNRVVLWHTQILVKVTWSLEDWRLNPASASPSAKWAKKDGRNGRGKKSNMRTSPGASSIKEHILRKHAVLKFVTRADWGLSQTLRSSHWLVEFWWMSGKMSWRVLAGACISVSLRSSEAQPISHERPQRSDEVPVVGLSPW